MQNKTTEEKIDYIYNHIRLERRMAFAKGLFKTIFYVGMIAYLAYFYLYGFEKLKSSIIEAVKPKISTEKVVKWIATGWSDLFDKAANIIKQKIMNKDQTKKVPDLDENF